jgi:predicted MFS family arabinose efflux permease
VAAVLLWWRERRQAEPFLDVRMLGRHRRLISVYAQFAAVNLAYYSIFFGLPIWLEQAGRLDPARAGLLLLPISGLAVLVTPLAARLTTSWGPRVPLVAGSAGLVAGALALLLLHSGIAVWSVLAVCALLGIPSGFYNLGYQADLYQAAPATAIGAAGGQFQTFRYVGAILSTSLLGAAFGRTVSDAGLHVIAVFAGVIGLALLTVQVTAPRPAGPG